MQIDNLFKYNGAKKALSYIPKEKRRELARVANNLDYNTRLLSTFSKETRQALEGAKICTFSVRMMSSILGRELAPVIPIESSAYFAVIAGEAWVLINTDINLLEATLIHETNHLKQWKRGDFLPGPEGVMWKGELWSHERIAPALTPENLPFQWRYLPWEAEAYGYQFSDEQVMHIRKHADKEVVDNLNELLAQVGREVEDVE